jgi:hypothetical protein
MKICDILVEVYLSITIMDQTEQGFYRAGARGLPQPIISIWAENYPAYVDSYSRGMKYHARRLDFILKATTIATVIVGIICLLPMFWGHLPNPILGGTFVILFWVSWTIVLYDIGKTCRVF